MHYPILIYMMVFNILLLLFSLFKYTAPAVLDAKLLSPTANVHVDVVNHVAQALHAHSQSFQQNWRDYLLVFLAVVIFGASIIACCIISIICLYRRLLFQLGRRALSTDGHSTITPSLTTIRT